MGRIWFDYHGYKVYNDGVVVGVKGLPLKPDVVTRDYLRVTLCVGGKKERWRLHRLISFCFLPNPNNMAQVNHKDGDKTNNHVDNLEWCDGSYNMKHSYDLGLRIPPHQKEVSCPSGVVHKSISEASINTGVPKNQYK